MNAKKDYNTIGNLTIEEISPGFLQDIKDIAVEVAGIEEAETTAFDASKYEQGHVMYMVDDVQEAIDKLTDLVDNTASNLEDGLMSKADKIKLDGIEAGANKYVHPSNHDASIITESSSKRFVSDTEKATWNAKETTTGSQEKATKALNDAKSYTDTKVASLVSSAPETLDTLNELAAALGNDPNFATTVSTQIGNKVDKVDGKGLSTNDYTTTEKNKLADIESGANKTVLNNTVTSTSTTEAATANAVKMAYDKANHSHPYAATSHGNHVPLTQTANNAVFLRNDNTWQTIKPANIGAAASSHTHNYAGSSSAGGAATSALACTGNSATATKLQTARTINGVSFDGTSNITIADNTKLPLSGGTLTGVLNTNSQIKSTVATGTAPLTITSTTVVANLNADMVDGYQASSLAKLNENCTFTKEQKFHTGTWVDPAQGISCAIKASGKIIATDEIKSNTKISSGNCSMQYNATTESLDFIFA